MYKTIKITCFFILKSQRIKHYHAYLIQTKMSQNIYCQFASIIPIRRLQYQYKMDKATNQSIFAQTVTQQQLDVPFTMKDLIDETFEFYERFKYQDYLSQSDEQTKEELETIPTQNSMLHNQQIPQNQSDSVLIEAINIVGKSLLFLKDSQKHNKIDSETKLKQNKQQEMVFQKANNHYDKNMTQARAIQCPNKVALETQINEPIINNLKQPIATLQTEYLQVNSMCKEQCNVTSQSQSVQSIDFQKQITFSSILKSKKRQSISQLQLWDKDRLQILSYHKAILQNFISKIDKNIKQSKQNFEIYLNFFRQNLQQQEKRLQATSIDTKQSLQNNLVSKTVYVNCSIVLNALSDEKLLYRQKIQKKIKILKEMIIQEKMEKTLVNGSKRLLLIRQNIQNQKDQLLKNFSEKDNNFEKIIDCQHTLNSSSDFYIKSINFTRETSSQIQAHQKLAEIVIQYYHQAVQEQINKSNCIRQSLILFNKILKTTHDLSIDQEDQSQLIDNINEQQQIKSFYEMKNMIDQSTKQTIKKLSKKTGMKMNEQILLKDFEQLLTNFSLMPFNQIVSLMKTFEVEYFNKQTEKNQRCTLVISIDAYLHLFINKQPKDTNIDPDVSYSLREKNVNITNLKGPKIQIGKKQQRKKRYSVLSLFWDMKKNPSYQLMFANNDAKQQFLLLCQKLSDQNLQN